MTPCFPPSPRPTGRAVRHWHGFARHHHAIAAVAASASAGCVATASVPWFVARMVPAAVVGSPVVFAPPAAAAAAVAVPEPSSLIILAVGALLSIALRRRA